MTRLLTVAIVAACVLDLSAFPRQQPTFRGTSDAVRVFVTVTDRDGRLIPTLEQKDFEIRDEGKPQPITLFDNSPQPIRLIIMIDVSGSMFQAAGVIRRASIELHDARDRWRATLMEMTTGSGTTRQDALAELVRRGWSDKDLAKIAGGNVLRALERAEGVAKSLQLGGSAKP